MLSRLWPMMQKGSIKSFNGRFRDGCLDAHRFAGQHRVRTAIAP